MSIYVPGTQEKDLSKVIMSLQGVASAQTTDETNISALQLILPASGQVVFPATQNPSANPNTLDDYEEGTWTPGITFATPGNLSATIGTTFTAYYTKIGRAVSISFVIVASPFTWTTASGNLLITGLPFLPLPTDANYRAYAPFGFYQGITKAGYSSFGAAAIGNSSSMQVLGSGSGVSVSNVVAADVPSGGAPIFGGTMTYISAT